MLGKLFLRLTFIVTLPPLVQKLRSGLFYTVSFRRKIMPYTSSGAKVIPDLLRGIEMDLEMATQY